MPEEMLIKNLREELQNVRKELHDLRELMTEIRVVLATSPKPNEVAEIEKRLREVERDLQVLTKESLSRRDYYQWLIPVLISVASSISVLGLKIWELLAK